MDEENNEENNLETVEQEPKTSETVPASERKGFNITSLVLGIISVVFCCTWYVVLPTGIMAIIFSIAGKKYGGKGMGTAGMILGIIGLVLCVLIWVYAFLMIGAVTSSILNTMAY